MAGERQRKALERPGSVLLGPGGRGAGGERRGCTWGAPGRSAAPPIFNSIFWTYFLGLSPRPRRCLCYRSLSLGLLQTTTSDSLVSVSEASAGRQVHFSPSRSRGRRGHPDTVTQRSARVSAWPGSGPSGVLGHCSKCCWGGGTSVAEKPQATAPSPGWPYGRRRSQNEAGWSLPLAGSPAEIGLDDQGPHPRPG